MRILACLTATGATLLLLLTASLSVYARVALSPEEDARLLEAARTDSTTRLYYHAEGGEAIPLLEDYEAVEWESERFFADGRSLYTPLEEMPRYLSDAFVAIEDHRFYRHGGVDILRTGKAILNSVFRFSPRFGGSTITQQLVKNLRGEREITATRKLREMLRARMLEKRYQKEEILEAYLNIVPMSDGYVGVGAGAMLYFGKTPRELTLAEAASIAAVTRAPAVYAPTKDAEKHLARRNAVLERMLACGMIDEEACRTAQAEPLRLTRKSPEESTVRSWYAEQVAKDVIHALVERGYSESAATALFYRGGLRVYTALNIDAQRAAEEAFASKELALAHGDGLYAAFVLLSARDGSLSAIVGNAGPKTGNRLLSYASDTLHAPASTLKPLALYAPLLEEGRITEASVLEDVPTDFSGGRAWPRNSPDRYDGYMDCGTALATSKNTVAVRLYEMLGAERIYAQLSHLGIDTLVRRRETEGGILTDLAPAPLALGELTDGVSLLSLVRAYLPLADAGRLHTVRSYYLVLDREGEVLLSPSDEAREVLSGSTASVLTHMLSRVTEEGSAAGLSLSELVDVAGKTGTSSGARTRLFVGYTPYYLGGVLVGYEDGRALSGRMHLSLFDEIMKRVHAQIPDGELRHFPVDSACVRVRVCRDSGGLPSDACAHDARGERTIEVLLPREALPLPVCDAHVSVYYDDVGEGVLLFADGVEGSLRRVSLIRSRGRDLPMDIPVSDAQYLYLELGKTPPARGENEPYFATLLGEGHYVGLPKDGQRPFNALSRRFGASHARPPETVDKDGRVPSRPRRTRRIRKKGSLRDFFDRIVGRDE